MKRKFLVVPVLAALLVSGLAGCAKKEEPTTPGAPAGGELPQIGTTIYKYDDNFMSFVRRAIETQANGKAQLIMNDSQNDQSKQNDQVETMISKGVKSLAINLVDPKAAQTIIDKAKAKNLPVIFFNKEPEAAALASYDKAWYVGTTSSESGVLQGQLIADSWKANAAWDRNGDGVMQYVLLKGEPGHPDAEARTKYAIEEAVKQGVKVEELAIDTAMWDTAKAKDKMDAWISKFGDKIEYVVTNNDGMALGALASLEGAGYFKDNKFMPIVGVDAIPDVLAKIKEGKIVGTVLNDATNQGKATFDLALNAAKGQDVLAGTSWKLDDTKAVRVPYVIVNKDNIEVGEKAYK